MPRRQRLTSLVLMGPAGSGKSSVMAALGTRLAWPSLEGDSLHPPVNVAKMAAGIPLTDADRASWLDAIAAWIGARERDRQSCLVTCSALKRAYRDVLRRGHPWIWFVHLEAPADVLANRITMREGHFMPRSLLDSQLATLERLEPDEPGSVVDTTPPPSAIAEGIIELLRLEPARTSRS